MNTALAAPAANAAADAVISMRALPKRHCELIAATCAFVVMARRFACCE